jgi:hypothetical protein
VDDGDDLGVFDALQIDGGDAEVAVAQLALDDVERDTLVGDLDGGSGAEWVGRHPPPHTGRCGDTPKLGAGGVACPGPATGRTVDHAQQRPDGHRHA